jgi:hypothetical protein
MAFSDGLRRLIGNGVCFVKWEVLTGNLSVMDLTPRQISALERLHKRDFQIVAFPMYANYIGVRRGNCAALLAPVVGGSFNVHGQPAYLVGGNFSVRLKQQGREWFVWKKDRLEVTQARLGELLAFSTELAELLLPDD